jgi:hypothetical protein
MNRNEILAYSSCALALLLYCPLLTGILRGQIKQNVATWTLWVSLDAIVTVSIILQKGNYVLPALYVIGGSIIVISLIYKKLFKWTSFETFVLILVIVCLLIWSISGSRWATIASTLAVCISSAPQVRDLWREPEKGTGVIYSGYALANILSFMAGKSWTVEERFYPGMMIPLCLLMTVVAFRKKN